MNIESFKDGFADNTGTCRASCACGREFYNPNPHNGWDFEEGELDELEAEGATATEHSVEYMSFEGSTYVMQCDCWKDRAKRVMSFLDAHATKIANYFKAEKERLERESKSIPF